MKPWIPIRVASITSALYCMGHSSGFPWVAPDGPENNALVEHLKSFRFDLMGASRTVWDFHVGFGLIISLDLLVLALMLWFIADLAKRSGTAPLRPLIATTGLAFAGNAILVGQFVFVLPLLMATFVTVCLGLAFILASRDARGGSAQPAG